jgi:uncharacterized Zn finger protein (UPF0148 family)
MTTPTGALPMLVATLRRTGRDDCPASGWELHHSSTASDGTVVCPSCSQTVPTTRHDRLGDRVRVVNGHHRT